MLDAPTLKVWGSRLRGNLGVSGTPLAIRFTSLMPLTSLPLSDDMYLPRYPSQFSLNVTYTICFQMGKSKEFCVSPRG
jgi:hypothetical protein